MFVVHPPTVCVCLSVSVSVSEKIASPSRRVRLWVNKFPVTSHKFQVNLSPLGGGFNLSPLGEV